MDWSLFTHFRTVARLNHLGRAAEELGISQPTLSRTIRTLEERYNVPLFERRGRTVQLNEHGRALLPFVERALQSVADDRSGDATIVPMRRTPALPSFRRHDGTRTIPAIVGEFRASDPTIEVRLFQGAQPDLLERLRDGRLDIALTSAATATPRSAGTNCGAKNWSFTCTAPIASRNATESHSTNCARNR